MTERPRVAVILGPTAAGKTAVALEVAERLGLEIVSADSLQVYRHLDIGTDKPPPEVRARLPHHLIDVVEPHEHFDAARYMKLARRAIQEVHARGGRALVVGGSMLYLRALLEGLFAGPPASPELRRRLAELPLEELRRRLEAVDPETAARLHPHDRVRAIRALEVYELTGRPLSAHQREHRFSDRPFEVLKLGLWLEREELRRRIEARAESMVRRGLLEETRWVWRRYGPVRPLGALGYRHMMAVIRGEQDLEGALARMKRDTKDYARRQLSWWRADPEVQWVGPEERSSVVERVRSFLNA